MDAEIDWTLVRREFEAAETSRGELCARHGIPPGVLERRARRHKWDDSGYAEGFELRLIIERLFFAIERQAKFLGEQGMDATGEKQAAVLAKLASSLEKLIELDRKATGRKPSAKESSELAELKRRIAGRLNELDVK